MAGLAITNDILSGQPIGQPDNPEHFDGKSTHREMAVPKMDTSLSVGAWIKIGALTKEPSYIVSKGKWTAAYSLGLWNGSLRWAIDGMEVDTAPLELGRWIYVAATFDGKRMCLFVDGV